jgi:ABC-type glycerol-3-phosphate transport system substrate-binding protein
LGIAFIFGYKKKAVSVYGTNIVLFKDATDEQKKGAWEFIKYFISPQVTAKWSLLTGYMPVRKSALKTEILQKEFKKDPQLKTTILQLKYGYLEPSDESWLLGREYLSEAINEAFLDKKIEKAYIEYQNALKSKSAETNIKRDFLEKIMEKQIKFYLDKAAEKTKRWMF